MSSVAKNMNAQFIESAWLGIIINGDDSERENYKIDEDDLSE